MKGVVEDALSTLGFTPEIAVSVMNAYNDPTSDNIKAVVAAYAANGQVVPGKLYAYLIQLNEERYPNDSVIGAAAELSVPWLILGAGVAAYLIFGRKKR